MESEALPYTQVQSSELPLRRCGKNHHTSLESLIFTLGILVMGENTKEIFHYFHKYWVSEICGLSFLNF